MRFGLGATVAKVATNIKTFGIKFLKDNLKIFFDFQNTDLEHVGRGSASFDGSNDVITITDNSVFSFGDGSTDQAFSITAWVKMIDATNFQIMNKGIFNTDGEWNFRTNSSDKLVFALYDESVSSTHESVISSALTTYQNQWIHVAATYDGRGGTSANDGMELYINGANSTNSRSGLGTYVAMENLTGNVTIGAGNSVFANGSIAQVGIWQRQLSSSEVLNIVYKEYSDLSGTELTHLFAWYPLLTDADSLVGVQGLTRYDGSNSGATFNSSVYGNNAPRKPRGVDNSKAALADQIGSGSASFNGVSSEDNINCGASNNIIKSNTTTYVFWIKRTGTTKGYALSGQRAGTNGTLFSVGINWSGASSDDDGKITIVHWDGSSLLYNTTSSDVLDLNKWHHVAVVLTGSSQKIYVDGAQILSGSNTFDVASPGIGGVSEPFTIGAFNAGASTNLACNIAQAAVYNEAMTQEKIQSISQKQYSELTTSEKTNLTSWWGLDSSLTGQNLSITLDSNNTATTTKSLENTSITHSVTEATKITEDTLTNGKVYKIVFTKTNVNTSGYCNLSHQQIGAAHTQIMNITSLSGTLTFYYRAVVSGRHLTIQSGGGGTQWAGTIDNISVEEYDGNPGELL